MRSGDIVLTINRGRQIELSYAEPDPGAIIVTPPDGYQYGDDHTFTQADAERLSARLSELASELGEPAATDKEVKMATSQPSVFLCQVDETCGGAHDVDLNSLALAARELQDALSQNRREGITDDSALDVQVMCVAEEAGELVKAYRRYARKARRIGTLADVKDEIADVLIVTSILAYMLNVDLNQAVNDKLDVIWSRGWKTDTPEAVA